MVATVSRPRAGRSARAERCGSRRREREFEIWQGPSAGGPPGALVLSLATRAGLGVPCTVGRSLPLAN